MRQRVFGCEWEARVIRGQGGTEFFGCFFVTRRGALLPFARGRATQITADVLCRRGLRHSRYAPTNDNCCQSNDNCFPTIITITAVYLGETAVQLKATAVQPTLIASQLAIIAVQLTVAAFQLIKVRPNHQQRKPMSNQLTKNGVRLTPAALQQTNDI